MSDIFTVSFFGHRIVDNPMYVEESIENLVHDWIRKKEYVEFLVGRNGDFDLLVASCILRIKKELFDANSSLVWVQPYPNLPYLKHPEDFECYYDEIEIFDFASRVHPKAAFKIRNQAMLDRSDFAVFWVKDEYGGAHEALRYAEKSNINHINLANMKEE